MVILSEVELPVSLVRCTGPGFDGVCVSTVKLRLATLPIFPATSMAFTYIVCDVLPTTIGVAVTDVVNEPPLSGMLLSIAQ